VYNRNAPKGCYFDNGMVEYYYNSAESPAECTSDNKCYCRVEEEREEFKITEKGVCGKSVSRETCQNEASKDNGRTVKDVYNRNAPKGCYFDNGMVEYYYNSAESPAECTSDNKCYCRVEEEREDAIRITSGLCEAREMSRNECKAYAKQISMTFHERSFSIYPGGCLVGPKGDIYYNERRQSHAKCGDHGVACVCNKHEDSSRFPATTSVPENIPCPDKLADNKCALYAANQACTTHVPYMSENCRTTCQIGGCVNNVCKDYHNDCARFAEHNYCNTGKIYMQYMCANSCNFCRPNDV